jgi:hypothetical protein
VRTTTLGAGGVLEVGGGITGNDVDEEVDVGGGGGGGGDGGGVCVVTGVEMVGVVGVFPPRVMTTVNVVGAVKGSTGSPWGTGIRFKWRARPAGLLRLECIRGNAVRTVEYPGQDTKDYNESLRKSAD